MGRSVGTYRYQLWQAAGKYCGETDVETVVELVEREAGTFALPHTHTMSLLTLV